MSSNGGMEKENSSPEVDLNVSGLVEKSGLGVKYEVVISDPVSDTPPRAPSPSATCRNIPSIEAITQKLEAAAERRQSLESEKLAKIAEKFNKIEEAARKRMEEEYNFINSTKEALKQKMEANIENKEKLVSDLKNKLSTHNTSRVEEVRQNMETTVSEFEEKAKEELQKKLETAELNRLKVMQEKLDMLKKHDEKVEQTRSIKRNSSICDEKNATPVDAAGDK